MSIVAEKTIELEGHLVDETKRFKAMFINPRAYKESIKSLLKYSVKIKVTFFIYQKLSIPLCRSWVHFFLTQTMQTAKRAHVLILCF